MFYLSHITVAPLGHAGTQLPDTTPPVLLPLTSSLSTADGVRLQINALTCDAVRTNTTELRQVTYFFFPD